MVKCSYVLSLKTEGFFNLTPPSDLFSSVENNRDEKIKLLSWPFSMAFFLFERNNRRISIDVDGVIV